MVEKIVSGGQTGADRAGLEVALALGLTTGGWVPRGRRADDGVIPERYSGLVETESDAYEARTEFNVRDSDATVIFSFGPPTGGSALSARVAELLGKPVLFLDLQACSTEEAVACLSQWLATTGPRVLNVAGSRQSEDPGISAAVTRVLREALQTGAG
jgi:hypothetical protein